MKRFSLYSLLWVALTATGAQAASFLSVANGVWSTGVDNAGVVLAGGSVDPHYTLIPPTACTTADSTCLQSPGTLFGPSSYVLVDNLFPLQTTSPAWVSGNGPSSKWIGPRGDQSTTQTGSNLFASNAVDQFYVYRMIFNLGALGLTGSNANISLAWASDNNGVFDSNGNPIALSHIRLCSISSASDPTCGIGSVVQGSGNLGQNQSLYTVHITNGVNASFTSGMMALDFVVYNSVLAFGANPTGLRVDILSATADNVPEPASLGLMGAGLLAIGIVSRRKR